MKRVLSILLISSMVVALPCFIMAQEEEFETEEYVEEEVIEAVYGSGDVTEVNVAENEIIISEYDYDTDEEIPVAYTTDRDTKFEGVRSLNEMTPGDNVIIEYLISEDGKKIATVISVYKQESEYAE